MTPIEEAYKLTKLIKQGKDILNRDFLTLAVWINKTYHVKTLNIIYDTIDKEERPRLQIILENSDDFFKNNYAYGDEQREAVVKEFEKLILKSDLTEKYKIERIFAIFMNFNDAAKREANWNIQKNEIEVLQMKLNIKELWKVRPEMFYSATFFLYTNEQVQNFLEKGMEEYFAEKYFEILKKYDEFNYYQKDQFSIQLNSKENFDNFYHSNWFYYDKR